MGARCTGAQEPTSYLDKEVDEAQGRDDDSGNGSSQQDDDAGANDIEHGAHEHLDDLRDHGVHRVHLLGEAVHQVPAGRPLEEAHGGPQDVVQQVQVQAAGGDDAPDGQGHGVAKHPNTYKHAGVKPHTGRGAELAAGVTGPATTWTKQGWAPSLY